MRVTVTWPSSRQHVHAETFRMSAAHRKLFYSAYRAETMPRSSGVERVGRELVDAGDQPQAVLADDEMQMARLWQIEQVHSVASISSRR
jgi:hypothetical protein